MTTTFDELEIGDLIKLTTYKPHRTGYVTEKDKHSLVITDDEGIWTLVTDGLDWELVKKKEPEVKADRKNTGKPRPTQIDWDFVNDVMLHMHKSEVKYPDKNGRPNYWSNFDSVIQQAHNSLLRHTMDLARGILVDHESGTDTVICIATNCMIINKHKEQYAAECAKFFDRKDKA